ELTRQNVSQNLSDSGIPQDKIESLINLIDDCEFAKYAPAVSKENMQPVYDRGAEVINGLEEAFKQTKQDRK
ncbi:MAG: hypothetical protein K2M63_04270, partial [Muribaculaceae bacterium]|nr:hypothetical protein [Muribaculaceae bacterium]